MEPRSGAQDGEDLTELLKQVGEGTRPVDDLMKVVHAQLHRIACAHMAEERPDHTLQPTALLNEAFLKLWPGGTAGFENRAHFFGAAARAMQQVLVESARRRLAHKRGGGRSREPLEDEHASSHRPPDEILIVDELLGSMDELDERTREVFRLWYFMGLDRDQIAEVLGVSLGPVNRDIKFLRRYVSARLQSDA